MSKKPPTNSAKKSTQAEVWKMIPDLDSYEASNLGRIRSLDRHLPFLCHGRPTLRFHRGRILRLKPKQGQRGGGVYWRFCADGGKDWQVNRAVCSTFHGPAPSSRHEAAHLDGDSNNNESDNLIWATAVENAAHKIGHGTVAAGSKNGASILREENVRPIFEAYIFGLSREEIAAQYSVGPTTVLKVVTGKTWKHVAVGELREIAMLRTRQNLRRSQENAAARMVARGECRQ